MREITNVESYEDKVLEMEIGVTTTFVRTNIHKETIMWEDVRVLEDGTCEKYEVEREIWVYDEKQYSNKEYIEFLTEQLNNVTNDKNILREEVDVMAKIIDFFATVFPVPTSINN